MTEKGTFAPIALFVYNRPWHTQQTIEALKKNEFSESSDLFIFSDAAKDSESIAPVNEVQHYLAEIEGFKSVSIIKRDENFGLAKSIISGVTDLCIKFGKVIVVEDDLVTSPFFLRYMNDALAVYANDSAVASIHGYWYPVDKKMSETFFLRGSSCWGWATWHDSWSIFESDGVKLLDEMKKQKLTDVFDLDSSIAYTQMLKDQISGKNNSWAIRWHASTFLANKLQLSPGKSLVRNIGFDGSGTHSMESDKYAVSLATKPTIIEYLAPEESSEARAALIRYYIRTRISIFERIKNRLSRVINEVINR